jgi:hypothetical protein
MAKTNLAQHEQHLKSLEKSLKEICDKHQQLYHLVRQSWTLTMEQFVTVDKLRATRIDFEKESQELSERL